MVKILTIGNSFAENATNQIEHIAKADGFELLVGKTNLGGCSLEKHWNLVEQCRLIDTVKPYQFYRTGKETIPSTLQEALVAEKWDYVTLQQVSDDSFRSSTYSPYLEKLSELISEFAPCAEQLIHQTWSYRIDSDEYKRYGINQEEMQILLYRAYKIASEKLGDLRILPSGRAIELAREQLKFVPSADFIKENANYPELPDQSKALIIGYHWMTGVTPNGKPLLINDGRHCNLKGCFLVGLLWYGAISGKNPCDNTYIPNGISKAEAEILRKCAFTALKEYNWQ